MTILNKFYVPDCAFDKTAIEQAAKNDAILIIPNYGEEDTALIDAYEQAIVESGLTRPDGSPISVMTWVTFMDMELYKLGPNAVLADASKIFVEMLGLDEDKVTIVEDIDI